MIALWRRSPSNTSTEPSHQRGAPVIERAIPRDRSLPCCCPLHGSLTGASARTHKRTSHPLHEAIPLRLDEGTASTGCARDPRASDHADGAAAKPRGSRTSFLGLDAVPHTSSRPTMADSSLLSHSPPSTSLPAGKRDCGGRAQRSHEHTLAVLPRFESNTTVLEWGLAKTRTVGPPSASVAS